LLLTKIYIFLPTIRYDSRV